MGRITPFKEELDRLKESYRAALIEVERRDAFDSLVEAWSSERKAVNYTNIPTVLDVMLLTAIVDNRKLIEALKSQLESAKTKADEIQALLDKILFT